MECGRPRDHKLHLLTSGPGAIPATIPFSNVNSNFIPCFLRSSKLPRPIDETPWQTEAAAPSVTPSWFFLFYFLFLPLLIQQSGFHRTSFGGRGGQHSPSSPPLTQIQFCSFLLCPTPGSLREVDEKRRGLRTTRVNACGASPAPGHEARRRGSQLGHERAEGDSDDRGGRPFLFPSSDPAELTCTTIAPLPLPPHHQARTAYLHRFQQGI